MALPGDNPTYLAAEEALREGDREGAEAIVRRAAAVAEVRYGLASLEHAFAQNDLGRVLTSLGQLEEALTALRAAADAAQAAGDERAPQARAVFLTNLGRLEGDVGRLADAEGTLRGALSVLEEAGADDALDFALVHEGLAEVLLAQGDAAGALRHAARAAQVTWDQRHGSFYSLFALEAELKKLVDLEEDLFGGVRGDAALVGDVARGIVERLEGQPAPPEPARLEAQWRLVDDLLRLCEEELGADHERTLAALRLSARVASERADHAVCQERLEELVRRYQAADDVESAVEVLIELALAANHAGRPGVASRYFGAAREQARQATRRDLVSRAFREEGRVLDAREAEVEEVERCYHQALRAAEEARDPHQEALACLELGVLLIHEDEGAEGAPYLRRALEHLREEACDPDAEAAARDHLRVLEEGGACSCPGPPEALEDAPLGTEPDLRLSRRLWKKVRRELPQDLVQRVTVLRLPDGQLDFELAWAREPSEEERVLVEGACAQALLELEG